MNKSTAKMREAPVEAHLKAQVETRGGVCIKLNPRWMVGIPDRLVVLPGRVAFVELKRPRGGALSSTQNWWKNRLTKLGCECHVLRTKEMVDEFLRGF